MKGDLDGDNKVTVNDLVYCAKYLASKPGYDTTVAIADLDGDGKVTVNDLVYLAKYLASKPGYTLSVALPDGAVELAVMSNGVYVRSGAMTERLGGFQFKVSGAAGDVVPTEALDGWNVFSNAGSVLLADFSTEKWLATSSEWTKLIQFAGPIADGLDELIVADELGNAIPADKLAVVVA
jgi:hypothetical protein